MIPLTPVQIAAYAYNAGFRGTALTQAVATSLAESGGNPAAVSSTNDYGLWQINLPTWDTNNSVVTVNQQCATDPACAASAAYKISGGGTSWTDWTTWKNGAAQSQLPTAQAAVSTLMSGIATGSIPVVSGLVGGIAGLAQSVVSGVTGAAGAVGAGIQAANPLNPINTLSENVNSLLTRTNWRQVGVLALGSAVILIGAIVIFQGLYGERAEAAALGAAIKAA